MLLAPLERRLQDSGFQWQGQPGEAWHVAIVAIDEDLAAYLDDPLVFWTDRQARASGQPGLPATAAIWRRAQRRP